MKLVSGFLLFFIQISALQSARYADKDEQLIEVLEEVVHMLQDEITKEDILSRAVEKVEEEKFNQQKRSHMQVDSSTSKLHAYRKSNPEVNRVSQSAKIQEKALEEYRTEVWKKKANKGSFIEDAQDFFDGHILKSRNVVPDVPDRDPSICPIKFECDPDPEADKNSFRTFDGSCNNLDSEDKYSWGATNTAQIRVLRGEYTDDVKEPRTSVDGSELPSARLLSKQLLSPPAGQEAPTNSAARYILMTFGQLLDHDLAHTPAQDIECTCDSNGDECMNIDTSSVDSFRDCIPFKRSAPYVESSCPISERMFANTITAWVDASNVYGSTKEEAEALYDKNTGKMLTETDFTSKLGLKPFLPYDTDTTCESEEDFIHCFKAGDPRQNENVALAAMHTIFMRYHNFIVDKIEENGFSGSGEEMYQVARHIVGAVWQHIVYTEYLPVILGRQDITQDFDLAESRQEGTFDGYDPDVNPQMSVAFSTSAFRFGHTEINNDMFIAEGVNGSPDFSVKLHEVFFNPTLIYTEGIDKVILGLINADVGDWDNQFAAEVREHLFQASNESHGLDLPALNIQRGRDHGLQGYVHWRKYCGIDSSVVDSWDELRNKERGRVILDALRRMRQLYSSVEDVDLFVGAMSERHAPNARVGPTFACLIADQFRRLKVGDRFFYENEGLFSTRILTEIRRSSLAGVLCETLDEPGELQQQIFRDVSDRNPLRTCEEIRSRGFRYGRLA